MTLTRSEAGALGGAVTKKKLDQERLERENNFLGQKSCAQCGEFLTYSKRFNKFCGRSCAFSYNNKGVCRVKRRIPRTCLNCTNPVSSHGSSCCSQACDVEIKYQELLGKWMRGEELGGTWSGVRGFVRKWLGLQKGEKCWECGWDRVHPLTGKVPVQVEHIDGDPYNHRPENLCLLCPNCHSLTLTFGALNKGKGRKERYAAIV